MTVTEVKTKFLIELDAVASGAAPGFTDAEISELVDKAQKDLVQQLAVAKKWDDLYTLIDIHNTGLLSGVYGSKSYKALAPANGYYVLARIKGSRQDLGELVDSWYNCDEISYRIADKFITTSFNKPFFKNPVVFLWKEDDSVFYNVLVDTYFSPAASNSFQLTYVKIPTKFNITTSANLELPEKLHENIVAMAVQEAAKSLTIAKMTNQ